MALIWDNSPGRQGESGSRGVTCRRSTEKLSTEVYVIDAPREALQQHDRVMPDYGGIPNSEVEHSVMDDLSQS